MLRGFRLWCVSAVAATTGLGVALTAAAFRAEEPPQFLLAWGSHGSGDGQFNTALGAAVDGASGGTRNPSRKLPRPKISRGARVTGVILEEEEDEPVRNFQVLLCPDAALHAELGQPKSTWTTTCAFGRLMKDRRFESQTDTSGRFAFEGIPKGTYAILSVYFLSFNFVTDENGLPLVFKVKGTEVINV